MAKVKVKVIGKGTDEDPFRVDLPTYQMIPRTEEYAGPEKKRLVSVEVRVPDDELDDQGWPDPKKIRRKYRGQPRWDHKNVAKELKPAPAGK